MGGAGGALAVFARWPEPGRVMPHLAARLGAEAAAEVYESFIADLVSPLAAAPFRTFLYAADHVDAFRSRLPHWGFPEVAVRPQQGRGEGRRLHACFEELLARHSKAVIVGSSLPDLHPRMLQCAFEMLDRRDVVIGPAERGGFYLLGMREPWDVFGGLRWGTPGVLVGLLRRFEEARLDYGFLCVLRNFMYWIG